MWKDWIKEWFPTISYDHVFISYLPIQGRLFRGATSYPSRGSYRKIAIKGSITSGVMLEKTRMVVSFVIEREFTPQALKEITDFLKGFGIKTNQVAVAFVVDGEMYYIEIKK